MKKTILRDKLALRRLTVRVLSATELDTVVGGLPLPTKEGPTHVPTSQHEGGCTSKAPG